jgi:hypothetical protein
MARAFALLRSTLPWLLSVLIIFPISQLAGQFIVKIGEEQGLFDTPSARLKQSIDWLGTILSLPGFWPTVAFVAGLTLGVWLDYLVRELGSGLSKADRDRIAREQKAMMRLGDQADSLAKGLFELIGDTTNRPPTHPRFEGDAEQWSGDNHERQERALRQFNMHYAAQVVSVIYAARKFAQVDENVTWRIQHMSSHDIPAVAQLLAALAVELRIKAEAH